MTLFSLACAFSATSPAVAEPTITILSAASLTDVLPPIAEAFKKTHPGVKVEMSFDGSSKLARQIEQGAPANIFFSADDEWMNELVKKGLVDTAAIETLIGNELVWIVPAGAEAPKDLKSAQPSRLALAGENVPISIYAKAALDALGEWNRLQPHVVRGENVRSALHWVAEKQADAGLVYATDAKAEPKVKVAFTVPLTPQQRLAYPVAPIKKGANENVTAFLKFLRGSEARAIFEKAGFKVLRR